MGSGVGLPGGVGQPHARPCIGAVVSVSDAVGVNGEGSAWLLLASALKIVSVLCDCGVCVFVG